MHTTDTKNRIVDFIKTNTSATNKQLQQLTGISQVGISQHLRALVKAGTLVRSGQHPRHAYLLGPQVIEQERHKLSAQSAQVARALNEQARLQSKGMHAQVYQSLIDQIKDRTDLPPAAKARIIGELQEKMKKCAG